MTQPLDPHNIPMHESEFCWGRGMFPPGIAANEGQSRYQDDFGDNMRPAMKRIGAANDNYARLVADKRTDSLDPDSHRDFEALGNTDRFGAAPPLVREQPQPNICQCEEPEPPKMVRKW